MVTAGNGDQAAGRVAQARDQLARVGNLDDFVALGVQQQERYAQRSDGLVEVVGS